MSDDADPSSRGTRAARFLILVVTAAACGPGPQPVHVPPPPPLYRCDGITCPVEPWARVRDTRAQNGRVEFDFPPGTSRSQAMQTVLRCDVRTTDNPREPWLDCPVDIGKLRIDVAEGPRGLTLMVRVGDSKSAEDLRSWYVRN